MDGLPKIIACHLKCFLDDINFLRPPPYQIETKNTKSGIAIKDFICYKCNDFILIGQECLIRTRQNNDTIRCKNG